MDVEKEKGGGAAAPAPENLRQCRDKGSFLNYKIKITDTFIEPQPLILQGDRPILSKGNISTVTGKPKAFKTFFATAILAAFLGEGYLSLTGCGGKALLIDTEQGKSHVLKVLQRVYRLNAWNREIEKENLTVLSLRELSTDNRLKITAEAIDGLSPDLVVIDGVRDLVKDFNDVKESSELVGKLMKISSEKNCGIINILHQNKADNNARGHLGSEICNKSETVLQVENQGSIATVSNVYSRNIPIEPFSFRINSCGLPEACLLPKVEEKREDLEGLFAKVMAGRSLWTWRGLRAKVMTTTGKGQRTVERKISEALQLEIISQTETQEGKNYFLNGQSSLEFSSDIYTPSSAAIPLYRGDDGGGSDF